MFDYREDIDMHQVENAIDDLIINHDYNSLIIKENVEKIQQNNCFDKVWELLDVDNKRAVINGEEYYFKKLINTIPLNHFVTYLPEEYQANRSVLHCNKVLVFNLGFDKDAINKNIHWTYFPSKDINFYRAGYYSNILGTNKLSMYIEIGYKENDEIDVEKQLQLTLDNLKKLGIITDHKLITHNHLIINPGYVHITKESNKLVRNLKEKLSKNNIYTTGRYGSWTYCSIEDCMIEAMMLAKIRWLRG